MSNYKLIADILINNNNYVYENFVKNKEQNREKFKELYHEKFKELYKHRYLYLKNNSFFKTEIIIPPNIKKYHNNSENYHDYNNCGDAECSMFALPKTIYATRDDVYELLSHFRCCNSSHFTLKYLNEPIYPRIIKELLNYNSANCIQNLLNYNSNEINNEFYDIQLNNESLENNEKTIKVPIKFIYNADFCCYHFGLKKNNFKNGGINFVEKENLEWSDFLPGEIGINNSKEYVLLHNIFWHDGNDIYCLYETDLYFIYTDCGTS